MRRRFATVVALFALLSVSAVNALSSSSPSSPLGQTTKNVATQVLQGTGVSQVDLDQYNLESLTQIEQEWTCQLVQKVGKVNAKPKLGAKSARELYVDTVQVTFPRLKGSGMGLELIELAGGREDDLGITLVAGLVNGGAAQKGTSTATTKSENKILPGDSIAQVSVIRQQRQNGQNDSEDEFVVTTECLSYEATVAAIQSLPTSPNNDSPDVDEYYALTLKRLRKKPKVTVSLQYPPSQNEPDVTLELFAGENLRHGMLVRGVKLNDPLAKRFDTKNGGNCGAGGLCRTCSVAVQRGSELLNPQRLAEEQMLADNPRWRLACKAIVGYGMQEGTISVRVNPRQWD